MFYVYLSFLVYSCIIFIFIALGQPCVFFFCIDSRPEIHEVEVVHQAEVKAFDVRDGSK